MIRALSESEKRRVRDQILPKLRVANPGAVTIEVDVLDQTTEDGQAQYRTMVVGPITTQRIGFDG